ncbi:MAG TPA: TlpA disulfide reductase family protein [Steroidobacteraceae bacterium]|jgi:thiol-disulfide isomerase/thioredoxin|nr:TlpA disulfide reductase family protein [Steroidobacteraceae bacterium]
MKHHFFSLLACFSCLSTTPSLAAQHTGPEVGSMAPDFRAHNVVTGHTAPLSSQRGKVVILTFWASWCAPCRREVPILEKAQRILGKDKLTVFAVSFKESQQAAGTLKKVASDWQINVIEDYNGTIASRYSITSIPHLFIIGRDGKVLANHLGYGDSTINELVDDINHAFAEPTPAEQQVSPPATDAT